MPGFLTGGCHFGSFFYPVYLQDVLFPYATARVREYLTDNWDTSECREDVVRLRDQALEDEKGGMTNVPVVSDPNFTPKESVIEEAVANVAWLVKADRKVGALKQLQGHIWRQGYRSGQILGHVYADAVAQMRAWHKGGIGVWIYSSGSVEAQKLLLKYSVAGDLLENISGHFDTAVGGKRDSSSYQTIAKQIGVDTSSILFVTDIVEEAKAAHSTGMQAAISVRPGNAPLSDTDRELFPVIESFSSLHVTQPNLVK